MRSLILLLISSFTSFTSIAAQSSGCTPGTQPTVSAPHANPWTSLSEEEAAIVNGTLQEEFNFTSSEGLSSVDSYVVDISLLDANKSDIIAFLDNGAMAPARYARATVHFGATNLTDSFWQEYMVGPLSSANSTKTKVELLTFPFNSSPPGKTKIHPVFSLTDGAAFVTKVSAEVEDITKELFNGTIAEGTVGIRVGTPFWDEHGRIISWATLYIIADPQSLSYPTVLQTGVSVRLDLTGRNWESWKATEWYSLGVSYENANAFRAAVFSEGYTKPPPNVEGNWTSTDKQGDPLSLDELPPPTLVSQGSQRFKLDIKENYVTWMDFAFYFSILRDQGLSLYDIQYKGKRIMYELSLQEAVTSYAGSEPFASEATFYDGEAGFGTSTQPLVRGYDCPSYATYLNATISDGTGVKTQPDAICIFEYDTGYPIRRHSFSPAAPHTSVAKNIVFTIRTIATVGNYDFMIEYNFYYDGAIEVSARASGYILGSYWDGNSDYGFHVHDYLSGSLHDHTLTWKADIDILGSKNSVQKIDIEPTTATYPWSRGIPHNTFKTSRSYASREASVNWPGNDAVLYSIVNKDTPNRFGEYPGYRFKRSAGTIHLTTPNSTNTQKTASFATHDFYVTKQKDTEPRAADGFNQFAPENPLVDFSKFLDNESIDQEDIVLWFNLGMHHMPHTGDLPNTMFTAAHSAMRFEPLNYLEGDPSVQSYQQVRIDYDEDGITTNVEEFGKMKGMCE